MTIGNFVFNELIWLFLYDSIELDSFESFIRFF